jgi:hypothetical protein
MGYAVAPVRWPMGLGALAAWNPFERGKSYTHPALNYRVDRNGTSFDLTTGKKLDGYAVHDRLIRFVSSGDSARVFNDGVDDVAFHNKEDGKWWKARSYDHPLLRFRTDAKQKPFDLDTGAPLTNADVIARTQAWAAATQSRVRQFGKSRSFFEHVGNAIAINARNAVKKPFKNLILPILGIAVTAALLPGLSGTLLGSVGKSVIGATGKVIGGGLSIVKKGALLVADKIGLLKRQQTGEPATSEEEAQWAREIEAEADQAARAAGHQPGTQAYDTFVAQWYEMMYGNPNNVPAGGPSVNDVIETVIGAVVPGRPAAPSQYPPEPSEYPPPYPTNYGGPIEGDPRAGAPGMFAGMSGTTVGILAAGAVVAALVVSNSRRS